MSTMQHSPSLSSHNPKRQGFASSSRKISQEHEINRKQENKENKENEDPEFLGYHDENPERLRARAPLILRLGISPSRLPAQISHLYVHRLYSRKALEARREKAFEAFGKPGRGLKPFSASFDALSEALGWGPQLRARRLAADWPRIVGASIAAYTQVSSYRDGVLVVTVSDTSWTQILRSMEKQILAKINSWMAPTVVNRLVLRGPRLRTRTAGGLRAPRKGIRRNRRLSRTQRSAPLHKKSDQQATVPSLGDKTSATSDPQQKTRDNRPASRKKSASLPHNGWSDPGKASVKGVHKGKMFPDSGAVWG